MKHQAYNNLKAEIKECQRCELGCKFIDGHDPHVVGDGDLNAKVMFIAEAPGKQETIAKECLTQSGKSGKIYAQVLKQLGLKRSEVYTTNIIACRPDNNRDPELYEILECRPYLERQIQLINPELIVTFGRLAAQTFFNNFKITKDHGKLTKSDQYAKSIFPLYHTSYIGCYAPQKARDEFNQDLKKLKKIIGKLNVTFTANHPTVCV